MISLVVPETAAFKETYRGALLCILLRMYNFYVTSDNCKFCTIEERNFRFSVNAQLQEMLSMATLNLLSGNLLSHHEHFHSHTERMSAELLYSTHCVRQLSQPYPQDSRNNYGEDH